MKYIIIINNYKGIKKIKIIRITIITFKYLLLKYIMKYFNITIYYFIL